MKFWGDMSAGKTDPMLTETPASITIIDSITSDFEWAFFGWEKLGRIMSEVQPLTISDV